MKLTPMDINNKEFKRVLRGYSIEEVDEFLDEVVDNYEELYKENTRLKEKLAAANEKVQQYSKIESSIQNTLVLAQNAAEEAKSSSRKEADMIIKNANETAQKILDKAHTDVLGITSEFDKNKQDFIKFRAKYRNFMNTQLETFNELEKELNKEFSIAQPVEEKSQVRTEIKRELKPSIKSVIDDVITEEVGEKEIELSKEKFTSFDEIDDNLNEIKSFFAKYDDDDDEF